MLTMWLLFCSGMDEDISRLKTTAVSLLNDLGCNGLTLTEDLINEMCRFGAAELHAVAAFIGGIASQEVIKVLVFCQLCVSNSSFHAPHGGSYLKMILHSSSYLLLISALNCKCCVCCSL